MFFLVFLDIFSYGFSLVFSMGSGGPHCPKYLFVFYVGLSALCCSARLYNDFCGIHKQAETQLCDSS